MYERLRIHAGRLLLILALLVILHALYMPLKALAAQWLLSSAWKETLRTGQTVKPWPWADTEPVARLSFPSLDETFIVLSGTSGRTLAFGPGHMTGTATPEQAGHIVISAHRDSHFSRLGELVPGDEVRLQNRFGEIQRYLVQGAEVVDAETHPLFVDLAADRLSLISCYPFNAIRAGGSLRYRLDAVAVHQSIQKQ